MPTYADLELALRHSDSQMSASEAHGCLCGLLCSPEKMTLSVWLSIVCEDSDEDASAAGSDHSVLRSAYDQAVETLSDPQVFLEPLIPGDKEPLGDRLEAIAEWCEGYLYGLALGGVKGESPMSDASAEVLRDLAEIARSQFEFEEDEEHEAALFEVIEYLRVGVQLIKEELSDANVRTRLH